MAPRKITERDIERYLVKRVKEHGGEVRKLRWVGRNGAPDRVVFMPDTVTVIWAELKAPGKRPTAAQLREHNRLKSMHQAVAVFDNFEAIDSLF